MLPGRGNVGWVVLLMVMDLGSRGWPWWRWLGCIAHGYGSGPSYDWVKLLALEIGIHNIMLKQVLETFPW